MASLKQIKANRKNAVKSTGPKSQLGKNKTSQNAFKLGLSIHPELCTKDWDQINQLADILAADKADPAARQKALDLAMAQYECDRVKAARIKIYRDIVEKKRQGQSIIEQVGFRKARKLVTQMLKNESTLEDIDRFLDTQQISEHDHINLIIKELHNKLISTERYLQRALSRRKFIMRQFYELS
jgi:hypothetical protein